MAYVSDHAVLRYMQRVMGIDVDLVQTVHRFSRDEIARRSGGVC